MTTEPVPCQSSKTLSSLFSVSSHSQYHNITGFPSIVEHPHCPALAFKSQNRGMARPGPQVSTLTDAALFLPRKPPQWMCILHVCTVMHDRVLPHIQVQTMERAQKSSTGTSPKGVHGELTNQINTLVSYLLAGLIRQKPRGSCTGCLLELSERKWRDKSNDTIEVLFESLLICTVHFGNCKNG